jgi:hypothetical protein
MTRSVAGILGAGAVIVALGVCGCGGGSVEEGVPKDLTPGASLDTVKMPLGGAGSNKAKPPPKVEVPPSTPAGDAKKE